MEREQRRKKTKPTHRSRNTKPKIRSAEWWWMWARRSTSQSFMEILSIFAVPAANKNSISSPKNTLYYRPYTQLPRQPGQILCRDSCQRRICWYRRFIAKKFEGSRFRKRVGRPRIAEEIERLVVRRHKRIRTTGYDRI